jgi:hypothetical protein
LAVLINFSHDEIYKERDNNCHLTGFVLFTALYTAMSESRVENGYSNGIFIHISRFLRLVTGLFPFSIGDISLWTTGRLVDLAVD